MAMQQNKANEWQYSETVRGGVRIDDPSPDTVGEYIYENRDVLLKADVRGLAGAQANPVNDIYLFKREGDAFSPANVWLTTEDGETASAFPTPTCSPAHFAVTFTPAYAEYEADYENVRFVTRVAVPAHGTHILLRTTVQNKTKCAISGSVCAALRPFVNNAVYNLWDAPEWYNETTVGKKGNAMAFVTKMYSSKGVESDRRLATFLLDKMTSAEHRLGAFEGTGSFLCPSTLGKNPFPLSLASLQEAGRKNEDACRIGYPYVYAAKCDVTLAAGQSETFSQVLSMQDKAGHGVYDDRQTDEAAKYLTHDAQEKAYKSRQADFDEKLSRARICTADKAFDRYVNDFLPLQLGWVASLDRGWPTGLRGVRDASNDFMGMLVYDPAHAREILLSLYRCQQRNGWLPRQVSTTGKGNHDLRPYADSGAFLLEFLYEYVAYTGDAGIFDEQLPWIDGEPKDSLCEHVLRSISHYLAPENIGEHGLCKIYGGDWLDAVNSAGLQGRGESVMLTCQMVMDLRYAAELFAFIRHPQAKELGEKFTAQADAFAEAVNAHAYNKAGFYNGTFCDSGKWLFSDCDEDGKSRYYLCPNAYAVASGVADKEKAESVLRLAEGNLCESGYRLFTPAMGDKPMHHAGRMGSGDLAAGLFENGNVYNHAQGFLLRAFAHCGDGEGVQRVLRYMLPYEQDVHPFAVTKTAPYAMVNCYQNLPFERGRGGMCFLTGTIAMAVRAVYVWQFGIRPVPEGVTFCPVLPRGAQDATLTFSLRGKKFTVRYTGNHTGNPPRVFCGKREIAQRHDGAPFLPAKDWQAENEIEIRYM